MSYLSRMTGICRVLKASVCSFVLAFKWRMVRWAGVGASCISLEESIRLFSKHHTTQKPCGLSNHWVLEADNYCNTPYLTFEVQLRSRSILGQNLERTKFSIFLKAGCIHTLAKEQDVLCWADGPRARLPGGLWALSNGAFARWASQLELEVRNLAWKVSDTNWQGWQRPPTRRASSIFNACFSSNSRT